MLWVIPTTNFKLSDHSLRGQCVPRMFVLSHQHTKGIALNLLLNDCTTNWCSKCIVIETSMNFSHMYTMVVILLADIIAVINTITA